MAIMTWYNFGEIMNNTFDFSYFVPTPDTTANCALSRWNDGLMGLSDFLKTYMSTRQSLEFGFSRSLNIKEILNLNLAPNAAKDADGKNDYVINYRKFGDIKAYVCGFEIPIVDFLHPFLKMNWVHARLSHIDYDTLSINEYVTHVFNYKSNLSQSERIDATITSLTNLRNDVENVMTDVEIATYFNKNFDGTSQTRSSVLSMIDNSISTIQNMQSNAKDFIFGYESKEDLEDKITEDISGAHLNYTLSNTNISLYKDLCYTALFSYPYKNFNIRIDSTENDYILSKYFHPNGIDLVFDDLNSSPITYIGENKKQILIYFRFNLTEKPTITPFISHDGTEIPLSKQGVSIRWSKHTSGQSYNGMYQLPSYWDDDLECPIYFDADGIARPMTLESNVDGMGGKDYTFWSSPVQKTDSGYQFECCMPLVFYNEVTNSYGNEYYATKPHDGIEVGQVMYRIPVVKRMRQNIEEAVVNTHLAKCLNDLIPATDENAEDDETVVLGGVVVDDFTEGLYPVAEKQDIATEREYGDVKITRVRDSDGEYNGVLDLMYHYSETGELTYNNMTMPDKGRAIDMITLFDTLKKLGGGADITEDPYFVVNGNNKGHVDIIAGRIDEEIPSALTLNGDFIQIESLNDNYDCDVHIDNDGSFNVNAIEEEISYSYLCAYPNKVYMYTSPAQNSNKNQSRIETNLDEIFLKTTQENENVSVSNIIEVKKLDERNFNQGITIESKGINLTNETSYSSKLYIRNQGFDFLCYGVDGEYHSEINAENSIFMYSDGYLVTDDDKYTYSILLKNDKSYIVMGKSYNSNPITTNWNENNSTEIITQNVSNTNGTAEESLFICSTSPTWLLQLNGNDTSCGISAQKLYGRWNLTPINNRKKWNRCDLGIEFLPWDHAYFNSIITNDGSTTDLDSIGIFNMHPRKGDSNDTLTIPIGGIICINTHGFSNLSSTVEAGVQVNITANMTIKTAKFTGTTLGEGTYKIGEGKYVFLNSIVNSIDSFAILMRIE